MISVTLPERPEDGNKGTFGRVTVIGGSENFIGAPVLCGKAAYRAGCGLVELAVPPRVQSCCGGAFPEAIWDTTSFEASAFRYAPNSVYVIGPGLSTSEHAHRVVSAFFAQAQAPCVVDADALNILSELPDWYRRIPAGCILTPHPGEMSRLCGIPIAEIQADRERIAADRAAEWGQIVVLKGAGTVLAVPDGKSIVLPYRTSALAKAGSGDVLAGMIAGLLAQHLSAWDAALTGAVLHAEAGLLAASRLGVCSVMATDVIAAIGEAIVNRIS